MLEIKKIYSWFFVVVFLLFLVWPIFVSAAWKDECLDYCAREDPTPECRAYCENPGSLNTDNSVLESDSRYFKLNVPIGDRKEVSSFGEYIQIWYNFVVGAVGIMATVIIMWGGFKWLTSRGNSAAISDAKDRIWSAIIGLILVFLSYNILYILNRDLLKLSLIKLPPINITTSGDSYSNLEIRGDAETGDNNVPLPIPPNMTRSSLYTQWPKFTGNTAWIETAEDLIGELDANGQLPPGFRVTSGWRSNNPSSQHYTGNATDVVWDNMTREEANIFVQNVRNIDPSISTIIEFNGEYGSTGNNVHLDHRSKPIHLD